MLIVLAACQPIVAPPANDQPVAGQSDQYTDPQGRYGVTIPTNWRATTRDGYGWLTSPQEQIQVAIIALPETDLAAAIAQAWSIVDPGANVPDANVSEMPPTGGFERAIFAQYDTGDSSTMMLALGYLADAHTYALLFRGDLQEIGRRASQLEIIQSSFKLLGVEETNLVGVEPRTFDETMRAELALYIERKLSEYGIPGAAVAVVQDGEIVYTQGFGVRALDSAEPVTPETLMMVGSTGKTMTTLMMATVVDDHLMAWETPVQEVLPQFAVADPALSQQITMRHLVCACTGVPRRDSELIFNANDLSAEDVVASLQEFEFFTEFGEAFQYSNQLVATGGYATAAATGAEWGNLYNHYVAEMDARVFEPIGMVSTTFSFDKVLAGDNYALPHTIGVTVPFEQAQVEMERVVKPVAPAGAPWSNALDMGRYLITELNQGVSPDGTRVVSAENLAVTWEPQVPVDANAAYGLGWFVDNYKGQLMLHHGGNTFGFTSDLAFLPESGIGISILTNGRVTNAFNHAVRFRLFELLFDQPLEYDAQADFENNQIRKSVAGIVADALPVEADAVASFLGSYSHPALGTLALLWEDGMLVADTGEFRMEVRALPAKDGSGISEYVIYAAPMTGLPLRLKINADGQPQAILGTGVDEYTFTWLE